MAAKMHTKFLLLSCCLSLGLAYPNPNPRYSSTSSHKYYSKDARKANDLSSSASFSSFAYAPAPQPPMQLTDNYNLIMPDYYDHHPAASMPLQNFANFHDAQMTAGADLGMDESQHQQFLRSTPVREPQPLNAEERRIRQHVPLVDLQREKKAALKLKKGSTKPRGPDYQQWDQFDYDLYSVNPGENKKYNHYG